MERNPLVSVCIPAYNVERYIEECLNSLLCQTYKNIEIIVVNDGSTDKTKHILDENFFLKGVKVIHQTNKGQSAAANQAFLNSKGDFVKFMDADDILSEGSIEAQINLIKDCPDTVASATWGRFYNDDISTFKLSPEKVWCDLPALDWIFNSLENRSNMMQCGLWLIPRAILEKTGLWDERLSLINDFEFFNRVLLEAKWVKFSADATLFYRSGLSGSLSNRTSREAVQSAFQSIDLTMNRLIMREDSNRARSLAADSYKMLEYLSYPSYPDIYRIAKAKTKEFGGSGFAYKAGGISKILITLFGWKLTKRIKSLFHQ